MMNAFSTRRRDAVADMISAATKGNADMLAVALESHRAQLMAMALRWLGYTERAQDAVQDTFVIALMKVDQLRFAETFSAWLFSILRNVCRMYLRSSKREVLLDGEELTEQVESRQCPYDTGKEFFDRMMMRDWVWKSLETLPDSLRVTVMLKYFSSFSSYEEIAAILNIPIGTVRSRLSAAKEKLSAALRQEGKNAHRHSLTNSEDYHRNAWEDVYSGKPEVLSAMFRPDAQLVIAGQNIQARGLHHIENMVREDLDAGVLYVPETILCSSTVSVIEGSFINPPDNPFHCPPTGIGVFFHSNDSVHTMMVFLGNKAVAQRQN